PRAATARSFACLASSSNKRRVSSIQEIAGFMVHLLPPPCRLQLGLRNASTPATVPPCRQSILGSVLRVKFRRVQPGLRKASAPATLPLYAAVISSGRRLD